MKKISLLFLLLGCSAVAFAAVAPEEEPLRTPITVVDASSKNIEVEVPDEVNYTEEFRDEDMVNVRQLRGAEETKRARNLIEQMQKDPEGVMQQAFGVGVDKIDMARFENKKALGANREAEGIKMKEKAQSSHWAESMADVQLPEFSGDYEDLNEMQKDYEKYHKEGLENIQKADFKQLRRSVPVMRVP